MLACLDHLIIGHPVDFRRIQLLERKLDGCHLCLEFFFIDVALSIYLERARLLKLQPLFLPLHRFGGNSCGECLCHHIATDDFPPVLWQLQALEQVAELLVHQVDAHHQVAPGRTGKTACFGRIPVVLPPVVGCIARVAAQFQTTVNTGDVASELVHVLHLLGTGAGVVHGLGHRTDLLPLVIRERRLVQPAKALLLVLDGSPVIAWRVRGVELVAKHRGYRVLVEEPRPKALTAGAVSRLVQRIGDLVGLDPLHAQLTHQPQAGVLLGVKIRRGFRTSRTVPEGDITIIQPLCYPLAFSFARMLRQHVREIRCECGEDRQLQHALRC